MQNSHCFLYKQLHLEGDIWGHHMVWGGLYLQQGWSIWRKLRMLQEGGNMVDDLSMPHASKRPLSYKDDAAEVPSCLQKWCQCVSNTGARLVSGCTQGVTKSIKVNMSAHTS